MQIVMYDTFMFVLCRCVARIVQRLPDWAITAPGSKTSLKIGYDYGMVTGELRTDEQELDLLDEDKLQQYKEHCQLERKCSRLPTQSPPALLLVSFARAKDWLVKQRKALSKLLNSGAINEEAREVVMDLNIFLADQPTSIAALLDQPAQSVVPTPSMSLGPEKVTDEEQAKERSEEWAKNKASPKTLKKVAPKKAVPKKAKLIPPELQERQARAAAQMLELSVVPVEASVIDYLIY